ncbi:hypothetical protein P5673_019288 [Acropora cervicornis]|uniref:Uncharacterized protein n=1 Tax=Acropora cervicornis TaxID=6130 RepID=A0AAD9QBJ3_ACRCE|nr:hypothetical protein P5673_019288 [Acropora cervicornis]
MALKESGLNYLQELLNHKNSLLLPKAKTSLSSYRCDKEEYRQITECPKLAAMIITYVLKEPKWFSIESMLIYRDYVLVFKCLRELAPDYLAKKFKNDDTRKKNKMDIPGSVQSFDQNTTMLKLGYQFVLVFLFARQCYLSPLNWNDLGQKAAETVIDSLVHNALKSAMGPSGEKQTLVRLTQDQERRDEALMFRSCGQIKYSPISHICCVGFVHRKSGFTKNRLLWTTHFQ